MDEMDRLPAIPLIANDPYFSVWMPGDTLTSADSVHWSGAPQPLWGRLMIDGTEWNWLGRCSRPEMRTVSLQVTPCRTVSVLEAGGVRLTVTFWSAALPEDPDLMSLPVTCADWQLESADGQKHEAVLTFGASSRLCWNGERRPPLQALQYSSRGLYRGAVGRTEQPVLGESGDHVTINWGYLTMASPCPVSAGEEGLRCEARVTVSETPFKSFALLGYNDIASILYFGVPCRAWYQRSGMTLDDAMADFAARHDELLQRVTRKDDGLLAQAERIGGEDYRLIVSAAWRHTVAAHKLIASPSGEMVPLIRNMGMEG